MVKYSIGTKPRVRSAFQNYEQ